MDRDVLWDKMRHYFRCAKWARRSEKLALLLTLGATLHWSTVACAATAYAECVDDAVVGAPAATKTPSAVRLSTGATFLFRVEPVRSWRIEKATLLIHIADGTAPAAIDVGAGKTVGSQDKGQGWIAIELPLALANKLASEAGSRLTVRAKRSDATIHMRESQAYSPYLVIDGAGR